jgi:hypothetical protein
MALTERYVSSTGTDSYANSTNPATPMSLTTAFANAVAGDRINIKADGTYTRTATDTLTNSGTSASPIIYRGYSSAIGDGNLGRTNGNGALITTNMPLLSYNSTFRLTTGANTFIIFESLNVSGNVSNATVGLAANDVIKSCKIVNASTNAAALGASLTAVQDILFDSDVALTGASGGSAAVSCAASSQRIFNNRINGGPAVGITLGSVSPTIVGNVIFASTGNHISVTGTGGAPMIYGNTLVGGGADAINIVTGNTLLQCIVGNMITDNTGDAIDMVSTANAAFAAYNRTRDNANGYNNAGDWLTATKYGDVTTDTGGPETDYVYRVGECYETHQTIFDCAKADFSHGQLDRSRYAGHWYFAHGYSKQGRRSFRRASRRSRGDWQRLVFGGG